MNLSPAAMPPAQPEAASLPNSCRPLQIIHGFDQWPDVTDAGLRERLRALQRAGLGGIVANVSFKHYLQDEAAWVLLRRGVELAHELGLRVWIYDEEGYPSGAAGGRVLEAAPAVEAQGLVRVADPAGGVRYEVVRLYEGTHATENFYQKRPCINILDPHAVATFLAVTHDRYAARLQPLAGYVEAFFTDEPALIATYIPQGRDYPPTLPWHERLPAEFRARRGYDLLPHLESLFGDTGPEDRKVRCDFHGLIAELCAETFFGGLRAWCRRHGVASSGHLLGEETMVWQTMFNGEPFACYRQFDIPGIDMITSDPEKILAKDYFMVPKVAGSACRLQGSRRLMCEISDFFGIMDRHHASREQMECTAGILFSCGVTDLCSYYTLSFQPEDTLKPGEFSVRTYRPYTDFVTRLNARFTTATVASRVAVLHPIVGLHAHYVPSTRSMYEPHPRADINSLDGAFTDLCRGLLQHQIDYDIVDEAGVAGAKMEGKCLALGSRRYEVLVLPPLDTIRVATIEAIGRFADAGGTVLVHALLPRYAAEGPDQDVRVSAVVGRMRAAGALIVGEADGPPIASLVNARVTPACELSPASAQILCTTLHGPAGITCFLVNVSAQAYVGTGTFPVLGRAVRCDPSTGEEQPLPSEASGAAATRVALALRPFESVFVDFRPAAGM